jgi:hypothetical protein
VYYILKSHYPVDRNDGYYFIEDGLDFEGVHSWASGEEFTLGSPNPIEINLTSIAGYNGRPPQMHDAYMLLMDLRLTAALKNRNCSNLRFYSAILIDAVNKRQFLYEAVNIIGLEQIVELSASSGENLDGQARYDTHFDSLILKKTDELLPDIFRLAESSGTIIVSQKLKEAIEAIALEDIYFIEC